MVGGENGRGVSCMVTAGHGVWVAMHNSSVIRLYHGASHDCLCELNVASAVTKMLAGKSDFLLGSTFGSSFIVIYLYGKLPINQNFGYG